MSTKNFIMKPMEIIASVTEPNTNVLWLNLNDNTIYRYGKNGWAPIGGISAEEMFNILNTPV